MFRRYGKTGNAIADSELTSKIGVNYRADLDESDPNHDKPECLLRGGRGMTANERRTAY